MRNFVLFRILAILLVLFGGIALPTVSPAQDLIDVWSQRFGDTGNQWGYSVAADGDGNVFVTGSFVDSVNFGGVSLISAGGSDIFLAKFDPSGNHLWSQGFGDLGDDQRGASVAADGSGNVIITGSFMGSVDFGGGLLTSAGDLDVFLASFDPSGNHLWSQRFGEISNQWGYSVAADGVGNVIIAGSFVDSVDFGGGSLTNADGSSDIFLAQFDPSGNHLWSQGFGNSGNQWGYDVAADGDGNVIITGEFYDSVDFGGGLLTSAGGPDIFLAKFDPSGNHLWSQIFGNSANQTGWSVVADGTGNVIITGWFNGAVDLGGGSLLSAGGRDIFLAKYDTGGNHLWSQRFGNSSQQWGYGVAADGALNAIITGSSVGDVDFGGGLLTSAGGLDIFLAKFDSGGNHIWSQLFGDSTNQTGWSVVADSAGNVTITGEFYGSVDFGGGPLTSAGGIDIFLARFSSPTTGLAEMPLPQSTELWAYPNPFNPRAMVSFSVDRAQHVTLSVLDMTGRRVAIITSQVYSPGSHAIEWNGKDSYGKAVSSGTYLVRMEAENRVESRKVMLVR